VCLLAFQFFDAVFEVLDVVVQERVDPSCEMFQGPQREPIGPQHKTLRPYGK
jgi:hypothetical protein